MTDYDNNLEKQILKLGGRLLLSHIGSNKMDIDYMVSPIYDSVPISAFGFTFDSTYSSASKPDSVSSASKPDTLSSASKPAFSSASNSIPCSVASINRIYIVYNTTIKERVNKLFIVRIFILLTDFFTGSISENKFLLKLQKQNIYKQKEFFENIKGKGSGEVVFNI